MAGIPRVFRSTSEGAIASYDWADVAEGTGFISYYGVSAQTDTNAANDAFVLSNNKIVSSKTSTNANSDVALDFDLRYNMPKIVRGTLYFNFCVNGPDSAGASTTPSIEVLKWDGTSETTIVAKTDFQAVGQNVNKEVAGKLSIPQTAFKSGETLRITLYLTGAVGTILYHNPYGTDTASFPALAGAMLFYVPYKLDL